MVISRADWVRRAMRKFGLQEKKVEAALDRISAQVEEHRKEKGARSLTKEQKRQVRMLRDAARKMLGYATHIEVSTLQPLIAVVDVPLGKLIAECELLSNKKQTPKRDDGFERRLAAEEARLLLPKSFGRLQHWYELTAILCGTESAGSMRSACRRLRQQLPGMVDDRKAAYYKIEAELEAERSKQKAELAELEAEQVELKAKLVELEAKKDKYKAKLVELLGEQKVNSLEAALDLNLCLEAAVSELARLEVVIRRTILPPSPSYPTAVICGPRSGTLQVPCDLSD
jgi:hypothetical protein